jgi:predicted phosphodiesterase
MRLHVISDLHQEFGEIDVPDVDCDVVVLAGDASVKMQGIQWIAKRFKDKPVIYICGNHEFYREKLPGLTLKLRAAAKGTNIHFLENDHVVIDGVSFFGATLWTDLALHGDWRVGAAAVGYQMNDYRRIRNSAKFYAKLTPQDTRSVHLAAMDAMRKFFAEHDPKTSVIVTHHAPSIRSLPENLHSDLVSSAYASHLDGFIEEHQPALWIHGHIHHNSDYRIGKTRVLANPRGYPDQPNARFVPDLVVEV